MNKTKKNGFLKVASLMLVVMMLATCVLASTMAKYTSTGSVNGGTVTPAKWDVKVGTKSITETLDTLTWTIEAIKAEDSKNDVYETTKIAPGTWGYAAIAITNDSEVGVTVSLSGLDLTSKANSSAGLSFKTVTNATPPTDYAAAGATEFSDSTTIKRGGTTTTIYICYQWLYDDTGSHAYDAPSTTLGSNHADISFAGISITATQVEPNKGE